MYSLYGVSSEPRVTGFNRTVKMDGQTGGELVKSGGLGGLEMGMVEWLSTGKDCGEIEGRFFFWEKVTGRDCLWREDIRSTGENIVVIFDLA